MHFEGAVVMVSEADMRVILVRVMKSSSFYGPCIEHDETQGCRNWLTVLFEGYPNMRRNETDAMARANERKNAAFIILAFLSCIRCSRMAAASALSRLSEASLRCVLDSI